MKAQVFRVFTNDRGRKDGVPVYSALCDIETYTAEQAAGKVNPEFGRDPFAPIVAIEWPATTDTSRVWLANHVI